VTRPSRGKASPDAGATGENGARPAVAWAVPESVLTDPNGVVRATTGSFVVGQFGNPSSTTVAFDATGTQTCPRLLSVARSQRTAAAHRRRR
jgi:hypothetical protein